MKGRARITLCFAYYDNAKMLLRHLAEWQKYRPLDKAQLEICIVDDASPNVPARSVLTDVPVLGRLGMHLQLYRVLEDKPWNQDAARNIAMFHARTEWCLLMDMDHVLPADQAAAMLDLILARGIVYMPNQILADGEDLNRPHPNGYLFNRADFWKMGGYDEDFAGWYGSDGNFRKCARGIGLHEVFTRAFHTVVYRREDIEDANTKLGRKGSEYDVKRNVELMQKVHGGPYRATNVLRSKYETVI